jgi:rhomboid protease GluP
MARLCATTVIFAICVVASIIIWTAPNPEALLNDYGYSTNNLLTGKFYVLVTSIFLHSDLSHLASNMVVLLIFGLVLEKEIGCKEFLMVFFVGAFFGDLLSSLIYPPSIPSIGASGGIFAIITATMLIKPIPMEGFMPVPLGIIAIGYIIYAIIGLMTNYPPHVSQIAHLGGAIIGMIYGCHKKGLKNTLKILVIVTVLLMVFPIIWDLWAVIFSFIIQLLTGG